MAGVLEAWLLSGCLPSSGALMTVLRQTMFPDFRSRQSRTRSWLSSAVTVNTLSPQTIGDACPFPGNAVFQTILLTALHRIGTFFSRLRPSSRGPRQQGQFSARAA